MAKSKSKITPVRQQYLDIKRQYTHAILFFRLGDFYETFDEDAEIVSRVLDIVLTSRNVAKGTRVPMAGIPHHAMENYVGRLIDQGYHVAICEQVGDEPIKGLMPREVVRVITPGTIVEPGLLPGDANNYLACAVIQEHRAGIAYVDITTGEFAATELQAPDIANVLRAELIRLRPAEILHPEELSLTNGLLGHLTPWTDWRFELARCESSLLEQFEVASLDGFGVRGMPLAVRAAGAVVQYLAETQPAALKLLTGLSTYSISEFMTLDASTRRNLELTETIRDGSVRWSLLGVLDHSITPMGKRLMRQWVSKPLLDVDLICERQDGVEFFFDDGMLRAELRAAFKPLGDLERLTNRILGGTAQPRDLVAVREILRLLPSLKGLLPHDAESLTKILAEFHVCDEQLNLLETALEEDPPQTLGNIGIIRPGYSSELDGVLESSRHAREWIANLEVVERKRTGIKVLKVGYNKVFGYYIEVTKANTDMVPEEYIRKQTLVNAERYITPEMKEYESLVLNAEERIKEIERRLFHEVCDRLMGSAARLLATARALARLDVLAALAEAAARNGYVRPEVLSEDVLDIRDGRHPVVEHTLTGGQRFVPNDTIFDEGERVRIITGPNMSGKCVVGDTLLFTDRGIVPIQSLQPQTAVLDHFSEIDVRVAGLNSNSQATHFYLGGCVPTMRITTKMGYSIDGTPDHRLWVRNPDGTEYWKRLGDIAIGDMLAIDRQIELWGQNTAIDISVAANLPDVIRYPLPTKLSEDLAYVIGLLIGDGTLTYPKALTLSTGDDFIAAEFTRIVGDLFNYSVGKKANGKEYFITSTQIRVFFECLDLGYKRSYEKYVPHPILEAPRAIGVAFLQGLFDADGFVENRYGNVRYSSSSLRLAREVQIILLNLGIITSLHVKITKARPNYRLSINGADAIRFHEQVGFRLPRKRDRARLASDVRRPNKGGIPYLDTTLKTIQTRIVAKKDKPVALKHNKSINSIFYTYLPNGRNISYNKLGELIDYCHQSDVDCAELEDLRARRYFYDAVGTIEMGESDVYDLSVVEDHAYIANGFVSHNSTFLRQAALIALLAQMGSFVPASSARIGLVDRIFTRIGAQDEIHAGQSTFMVEMVETANILHHATPRSLLVLDEIGRGTSTYDGVSIAWAMVEYLHNHPGLRAKTLFATHYHELTQLSELLPGVYNYNVAVSEADGEVVFLHKIVPGGADRSYGIHVAQLAGLPRPVIQRAGEILKQLEGSSGKAVKIEKHIPQQLNLFPETNPLLDELEDLDLNTLSPIEALNRLYEWQKRFLKSE